MGPKGSWSHIFMRVLQALLSKYATKFEWITMSKMQDQGTLLEICNLCTFGHMFLWECFKHSFWKAWPNGSGTPVQMCDLVIFEVLFPKSMTSLYLEIFFSNQVRLAALRVLGGFNLFEGCRLFSWWNNH